MGLPNISLFLHLASLQVGAFLLPLRTPPAGLFSPSNPHRHVGSVTPAHRPSRTALTCSRQSMGMKDIQLDRRGLIRAVGGALAVIATSPDVSEAAPAVARRPGQKRSPAFLCDDDISYLYNPVKKSEIWLVGTAHISNSSATLVENVIRDIKPQVVMVELDAKRVGSFIEESRKGDKSAAEGKEGEKPLPSDRKRTPFFGAFFKELLDPNVTLNDRVTDFFAAALGKAISKMYESMDQKGLASGQEFTIAIREARACGAKLLLGDRDVQVTLRRLSEALRSIDLQRLSQSSQLELGMGLEALDGGSAESINSSVEILKQRETMRKVVSFYKEEAPELYNAMLGERDKVMAVNLMSLDDRQTTVAVVGLAHVDGIEAILAANGWKPQRC